jgi:hypothetical protein
MNQNFLRNLSPHGTLRAPRSPWPTTSTSSAPPVPHQPKPAVRACAASTGSADPAGRPPLLAGLGLALAATPTGAALLLVLFSPGCVLVPAASRTLGARVERMSAQWRRVSGMVVQPLDDVFDGKRWARGQRRRGVRRPPAEGTSRGSQALTSVDACNKSMDRSVVSVGL